MEKDNTAEDTLLGYENPSYDMAAKRFLSKRKMLVWILKRTVSEFANVSLQDIENKYIEGEVQLGEVPVNPDKTNTVKPESIKGSRNEDGSSTEGWITFDILFHAKAPQNGELITLIINIEAQKKYKVKYPLLRRAVYYASRLISSQKGREFSGSDYGKMKKVYTIWICMTAPQGINSINRYNLTEKYLFHKYQANKSDYDMISIVMVYLGRRKTKDRALELLRLVFKENISAAKKKKRLDREYDMDLTSDMEEELKTMCNLSEGIAERAESRGFKIGMRRGEQVGIRKGRREARQEAIQEKMENAVELLKLGIAPKFIAKGMKLSIEKVLDLEKNLNRG